MVFETQRTSMPVEMEFEKEEENLYELRTRRKNQKFLEDCKEN